MRAILMLAALAGCGPEPTPQAPREPEDDAVFHADRPLFCFLDRASPGRGGCSLRPEDCESSRTFVVEHQHRDVTACLPRSVGACFRTGVKLTGKVTTICGPSVSECELLREAALGSADTIVLSKECVVWRHTGG